MVITAYSGDYYIKNHICHHLILSSLVSRAVLGRFTAENPAHSTFHTKHVMLQRNCLDGNVSILPSPVCASVFISGEQGQVLDATKGK